MTVTLRNDGDKEISWQHLSRVIRHAVGYQTTSYLAHDRCMQNACNFSEGNAHAPKILLPTVGSRECDKSLATRVPSGEEI